MNANANVIVYVENGSACVMSTAPGLDMTTEEIAARDVPSGCDWIIVQAESLPDGLQEAWIIEAGEVVVDATRVKSGLIGQAEADKKQRKLAADNEIDWRQYAVSKGIATEEESAALAEWSLYRVRLMRVDTSKAPDIEWPTPPVV